MRAKFGAFSNIVFIYEMSKKCAETMLGWHSGDCASFVMRNYQGFESLTQLHAG